MMVGCTSMRPISPKGPEMSMAKKDDFLRIHFRDGTIYEGRFQAMSSDSIEVSARSFALDSIQFIEKAKVDGVKTAGAVVGTYVGAFVISGLIAIGAFFFMIGEALE
jgi:hypothetical protein